MEKNFEDFEYYTNLWKFGTLSNFDYLIYINTIASRSFNDLSQYPIFPWVISNYEENSNSENFDLSESKNYRDLSKPIGALSQYKLEHLLQNFQKNAKNFPKEKNFLYPEFYSTPGIVTYFLVRSHPLFLMKFKNGSLGNLENLFNSIKENWNFLMSINNDVRELTPEFFSGKGDFLVNINNLNYEESAYGNNLNNFDNNFTGKKIENVQLPKWAKNAEHFISINKSALESNYVSNNLHKWIDLVFGCKQNNEAAISVNNLFYSLCYEENVKNNLIDCSNSLKKQAFIVQISEYGQVPKCLFKKAHLAKKISNFLLNEDNISDNSDEKGGRELQKKIERLVKDNKKLEDDCGKIEREKNQQIEDMIKTNEEIECKRNEKIDKLKR